MQAKIEMSKPKFQVVTVALCDPDHSYTALQKEMDNSCRTLRYQFNIVTLN